MLVIFASLLASGLASATDAMQPLDNAELQCPPSLKVIVPSDQWTMANLHSHLKKCHNMTGLDLRVTWLGCVGAPDRWEFPFNPAGGDRYPNLTSLKLEGYDFDWIPSEKRQHSESPWSMFRQTEDDTPVATRNMTSIQLWLEAMDWSHIESLHLEDGLTEHAAEVLPPHLTSLKHLTLFQSYQGSASDAVKFTYSVPSSLETLEWVNIWAEVDGALEKVLTKHGETLKNLDLHYNYPKGQLTTREWDMLQNATNLEHLVLNIDRNGTWPWEALEALSTRVPSLKSAHVWLELGSDMQRQDDRNNNIWDYFPYPLPDALFREPRLNQTTAAEAFAFLRAKNRNGTLTNVTFSCGDFSRRWDGPDYISSWEEGRRTRVVCLDEMGKVNCETVVATAYPNEDEIRDWDENPRKMII